MQAEYDKHKMLEGEWTFTGYTPADCQEMPKCHTNKMVFTKTNPKDETPGFTGFSTIVNKDGPNCTEKDRKSQ